VSDRLYYDEPYQTHLTARVVERLTWEGQPAVILDRTLFYPTSGGQPHDTGVLAGLPVVDVVEREVDGAVVHILAASPDGQQIEGQVDWQRRFDLMQQHTGQHILSAAFVEGGGANTVGFHVAGDYATIDLDRAPMSTADLTAAEMMANSIIFENRPVIAHFVPDAEVPTLRLRKALTHVGPVRIVEIPGFDCSACGGTHVRATGEVGLIKITRSERRGEMTRIEFVCGWRALADYRDKNTLVMDLAREFTVGHWELADLVHRLDGELKEARRELRRTRDALLDAEADALWHQASLVGPVRIVQRRLVERAPDDLKHLIQRLVTRPHTVALLASGGAVGQKGHLAFARSADLDLNMGALLRQVCESLGGRGGGRPEFAQGGVAGGEQLDQALDSILRSVVNSISLTHPVEA
jgi:alanyl-tRNA synthetase